MAASADQALIGDVSASPAVHDRGERRHLTRREIAARFGPATVIVVVWLGWLFASGGYFEADWYPVAIGCVALLVIQAITERRLLPASGPARLALLLFGLFVAWNFASISWAISADAAWQASNQYLLYLLIAWIFALTPWTARSAAILAGVWSIGCAAICALFLIEGLGASNLTSYLSDGRWQQPIGYANATSAVAAMAFLLALMLSADRNVPAPLRVVYLVAAAFLVDFALLPQSRGALVGIFVAIVVLVAVAPNRVRLIPRLAVVGLVVAVGVRSIYSVYDAADVGHPVAPVLHHAAARMLLGTAIALVSGIAIVLMEMRARPSARLMRRVRLGLSASLVACIVVGLAVAVVEDARIGHYISRSWHFFSSPVYRADRPGPRIAFINSDQRYDMWRDALRAFRASPLHGIGNGSFQYHYIAHRRVDTYLRQPHDLWLRVLSETGVVGALLFVGMLAVMLGALLRARWRLDRRGATMVTVSLALLAYWLVHSTVDWLDVVPAVAALPLALPFAALAAARRPGIDTDEVQRAPRRRATTAQVLRVAAAGGSLAAVLSFALPYLASRQLDVAVARARHHDPGALAAAREAAHLDPLATLPHDVAGTVALEAGRLAVAQRELSRSLELQNAWYPHLERALLYSETGRFALARSEIGQARVLDPADRFLVRAARLIERRHAMDPIRFNASVLDSPLAVWGKMV